MPLKKQPSTLRQLCTQQAVIIATSACVAIGQHHGDYEKSSCRREINILRNYFLDNIGLSFEKMCLLINRVIVPHRFPVDLRILVDFMFHENKQIISLPGFKQAQEIPLHITSTFWAEKLGAMKRITNLNLSEIRFSDEIVRAISDNCVHLQFLHIWVGDALTDKGLLLLRKCSELLIIIDVLGFGIGPITMNAIKLLVEGLPRLIAIHCHRMGAVLSSGFENTTLFLRSVEEHKAEVEHIEAIAKLCPNLKRLSLWNNQSGSLEILNPLTVSNLKVYSLVLRRFYSVQMAPLLREKGKYLQKLKVIDSRTYNTKETLTLIGLNCPILNHLTWITNKLDNEHVDVDYHYKMSKQEKEKIFLNLDYLSLNISASDFDRGIPQLCLLNALNIKVIEFIVNYINYTYVGLDLDAILSQILLRNNMALLKRLSITAKRFLTTSTKALELIFKCQNLKEFEYKSMMNAEVVEFFKLMESKILENNLQLQLIWSNLNEENDNFDLDYEAMLLFVDEMYGDWIE